MILNKLYQDYELLELFIPYDNSSIFYKYYNDLIILGLKKNDNGLLVKIKASKEISNKLNIYKNTGRD